MILYKENISIASDQIEGLYNSVGWVTYTNDMATLCRGISRSLYVLTAWDDERLIGLIRVIGDGETIIYIQDLLVNPTYQQQGVGERLMTKTLAVYKGIRQKVLLTEDAPLVRHFYEKNGFVSCDQGGIVSFYREY